MTKIFLIRTGLAVTAAALLCGGGYLLVRDDVQQKMSMEKIEEYVPTPENLSVLDNIHPIAEIPENEENVQIAIEIPAETEKELTEQAANLSREYDEAAAWLYILDTNINYPIMQSNNNDYYLHRAVDGSYLYAGSLFLDFRCDSDFGYFTSIIYGHNMKNGSMFADIAKYADETYFYGHNYGWLTTDESVKLIDFFAVEIVKSDSGIYEVVPQYEHWLAEVKASAVIYENVEIAMDDNVIMLSTCWDANTDDRIVLMGKIID